MRNMLQFNFTIYSIKTLSCLSKHEVPYMNAVIIYRHNLLKIVDYDNQCE